MGAREFRVLLADGSRNPRSFPVFRVPLLDSKMDHADFSLALGRSR